ncbi:hypothetical protein RRF57_004949 [Xylaria bambusicola]|uniref:Uncharacterized protein n=1 Tax=Xylaria bambusicola TaxID=326684 RepID=A0AAN7UP29_9PEZI
MEWDTDNKRAKGEVDGGSQGSVVTRDLIYPRGYVVVNIREESIEHIDVLIRKIRDDGSVIQEGTAWWWEAVE